MENRNKKRKELDLGNGMLVRQVEINSLREQDINPRILPNTAMRQLIKNVGNRGMLESLPYCVQTDEGIEIVSGHHRVRAARAASLQDIFILLDTSDLSRDEIKAKQIAHNTISGFDDPELLAELYSSINSAGARLEAYVDEDALKAQLLDAAHIDIGDIETDINFRMATFLFLPHQLEKFDEMISLIDPDTKLVGISELSYFEKFKETLTKTRECEDIRSLGMILSKMCDIVLEHYAELKEAAEKQKQEKAKT